MTTIDMKSVGGKHVVFGPGDEHYDFGWRGPASRVGAITGTNLVLHEARLAAMPRFLISGAWQLEGPRYALWKAAKQVLGRHLSYNHQLTGSCVGAGGGNMLKTQICVEISQGDPEEYREVWWPYTYGRSRTHSGMDSEGEGSSGSGWAEAITRDGSLAQDETASLPPFRVVDGWLQLTEGIEFQWSRGAYGEQQVGTVAKKHLVKTASPMRSAEDCIAALANGYCITQASNFGFRSSKVRGTPPVRIAPWDGSWSHQTYVTEYWDHPTEGEIFYWGNNWGPKSHGEPTGDEPPGGVYIEKETMEAICRDGETYAFSAYNGFPARKLTWLI